MDDFTAPLAPSPGTEGYLKIKDILQRFLPPQFAWMANAWMAKSIPGFHESMHSLDTALLMEFLGHALSGDWDKVYNTLDPSGVSPLGSWIAANRTYFASYRPAGETYSEDQLRATCNGKLLTFDRKQGKESLAEVNPGHLSSLFTPGRESSWPQLILTTNHALARNEGDLSDIMHGFLHLVGSATGLGRAMDSMTLPEMQRLADAQAKQSNNNDPAAELKDKVVMVTACHTEKNSLLSGAKLLRRIETLSRNWEEATGQKVHSLPTTNPFGISKVIYDKFMRSLGKDNDPWNHMSPAAVMLAKNILNLLVVPEDQPHVYNPHGGHEDPYLTAIRNAEKPIKSLRSYEHRWTTLQDSYRMREDGQHYNYLHLPDPPIALRKDAEKVAQHIHLMGYSRGGNTVTDAMRYVVHELQELSRNGNLVRAGDATTPAHPMGEAEIAGVIKNISLLSMAAGEIPLSPKEIKSGIRRVNVISDKDLIAGHFTAGFLHEEHMGDDLYKVRNGTSTGLGHDHVDALGGVRKNERGQLEEVEGFMVKDPAVRDALRSLLMPMLGKACISDIEPLAYNGGKNIRLIVRSPAGTTAEMVETIRGFLEDKLSQIEGAEGVTITHANHSTSLIINGLDGTNSVAVLQGLKNALEELNAPGHEHEVTINPRIIEDVKIELEGLEENLSGAGIRQPAGKQTASGPHAARVALGRAQAMRPGADASAAL